jgi:1-pyrroline-5-carboxylate dehydrogenase
MKFRNEDTFGKFSKSNEEHVFHEKYEEAIEKTKLQFGRKYAMLIDGKSVRSPKSFVHVSPIDTRVILGYFPKGNLTHAKIAIQAAERAFQNWKRTDYQKRVRVCRSAADMIADKKFELSAWISFENGKNRYEAVADVDEAIDFIKYYSIEMESNDGYILQTKSVRSNERSKSVMKPYGVWGVISPFNFPAGLTVGMCTGALITGNAVVLKPASDTPIIGYLFTEIMKQAGLPDGALNFVTGSGEIVGNAIVENRKVVGIAFTGSKAIGDRIIDKSTKVGSRTIIAEMGGKNPVIVTENAEMNIAVEGVINAAFGYSGQKCSASSRIYVHRDIKDDFIARLIQKTRDLRVGNPVERKTFMGPLINSNAYDRYQKFSKLASKDGKILIGGKVKDNRDFRYGYYVEPTIIDGLPNDNRLFEEELFVPILCVAEYESFDEAIFECNKSEYGLTAGIYSDNKEEIEKFLENIEVGVAYVNRSLSATTGAMVGGQSFGGWKASGTTGKGTGGSYYLTQFLREQSQTVVVKETH